MIFYHGTTRRAAEAIQREGLRPHREKTYNMLTWYGANMTEIDGWRPVVYLAKDKEIANRYANFRTTYEMAEHGAVVEVAGLSAFTKQAEACGCVEEPVILSVDVPDELLSLVDRDPEDHTGFVCECSLEPQYILGIEPVHTPTARTMDDDLMAMFEGTAYPQED